MQKAAPLLMVLFLAVLAIVLSNSPRDEVPEDSAPAAAKAIPAEGEEIITEKTDIDVAVRAAKPWPQQQSDIPAEEGAVFGSLANGMRYIIYPNVEPPERVSLRLHIDAGSLMEAEDQRGIAHFLEHMVFNGTKHYSASDLIPKMQRLGISFGAHANAYTSFDETVYMLDLPDLTEDTMDLAFTVMRDFGDGALLAEDEINKERGVILSEKISRDSASFRLMQKQFAALLPESLLAERFPIGLEEVIENAPRERFVDFYTRYYTPERMTFIVVGDIDVEEMEDRIGATFASMRNPVQPGADPDPGKVYQPEGIEGAVFSEKELTSSDVSLVKVTPYEIQPDTRAKRAKDMPLDIAHAIMNRRFERIAKEEGSPVASGSASNYQLFNVVEMGSIDITAADDRWLEVVPILENEFRRATEFGFTEAELAEAKANVLNAYQQQVKRKPTRKSDGIATVLARTINDGMVFSDPQVDLDIAKEILDGITVDSCHEAFVKFWQAPGYHLVLRTKDAPENAESNLVAAFEEARGKHVSPPEARAAIEFAYTDFGAPGTVAEASEVEDLEISQWVLSNGVRVNLKRTEFEKDRIRMMARIGSGKLSQPDGKPMFDRFATALFEGGGLGKHSVDELQQVLAGKNVYSSLSVDEDAFVISGGTTPSDFALQCQLMCASIIDPGFREEAMWQFQKAIPMLEQQLKHTPAGPQMETSAWMHGGDSRYQAADSAQLKSYTIDDAKSWLMPELTGGYLELSIVGDFTAEEVEPVILATFGALPKRAAKAPEMADARAISMPAAPAEKEFTYQSKVPQGIASAYWKTPGLRGNIPQYRRLNVLADILGDRLREEIREKLGASYSPSAGAGGSDALTGIGYLATQSVGKPEDLELLLETMRSLANQLAAEGASADELDRAMAPMLGQLKKTLRENSYWLSTVMSQCQSDPEKIELARNRDDDYASITLDEINALAKQYLSDGNCLTVAVKSVDDAAEAMTEEGQEEGETE
ncbi:MAG: M16 family metallopeptidase [Verrucomicrobiota bacterium JB025]|nr:insulinase family protein [Verrucomicrobiota bacterium JB025]